MYPIKIFYHVFIPEDSRGLFWNWWIDEQLRCIEQSNLPANKIGVSIHITMPKYWNNMNGIDITSNGSQTEKITFESKVREYIETKYPWAKIDSIRDTGEPNLYEGTTLKALWDFSKEHRDHAVGYIHTKGVMSLSVSTKLWREALNHTFITDWQSRYIEILAGYDVSAVKDLKCDDTVVSGNFFWANTNYIAKLPEPLYENRYGYEKWILSCKSYRPKLNIIHNSGIDHFIEYC